MPKGIALTIGLNSVDQKHYGGWSGNLNACEADAQDISEIATINKFAVKQLLTNSATRSRVTKEILNATESLQPGDIFMLFYSGHGGQVPDASGDEPDSSDETWCLYDGELIDDELLQLWKGFAPGVRVLVLSDSCHSGTVTRAARGQLDVDTISKELRAFGIEKPLFRFMPPAVARETYFANRKFYDDLGKSIPTEKGAPAATVRLLSACQDNQTASEGLFNGLFTGTLLKVWNGGAFEGDYARFYSEIVKRMPSCQTPNHLIIGPNAPAFDRQKPFAIEGCRHAS